MKKDGKITPVEEQNKSPETNPQQMEVYEWMANEYKTTFLNVFSK